MKRILVIDDNQEILNVIQILLEMEGYDVKCKSTGDEAIETVFTLNPNLILLDIMLGQHDGREICKDLKSNAGTKHIPIIMISASHSLYDGNEKVCSADDFIAKPFDINDLVAKVQRYID
jgi:DNA-binding response OmpR family regulator